VPEASVPTAHRLPNKPLLAVDTSSPIVSLALLDGDTVLALRTLPQRQSSGSLLPILDEMLREQHLEVPALGGLVALRGPGSFTGLRIGLATILGLHQATGLPALALSTLQTLAAAALEEGVSKDAPGTIVAAVDALRGDAFIQTFGTTPTLPPLAPPQRLPISEVAEAFSDAAAIIGFGVPETYGDLDWNSKTLLLESPPLAPTAGRLAVRWEEPWEPADLTRPLYLKAPAVSLPKG